MLEPHCLVFANKCNRKNLAPSAEFGSLILGIRGMKHENSTFDPAAFATRGIRLANWIDEAKQSGDLSDYRGRSDAVIAWFEQMKAKAPPEWVVKIDLMCAEFRQVVASLPKPERIPSLPDFSVLENAQNDAEVMRTQGIEAAQAVESGLKQLPYGLATDIAYCLDAARGLAIPDHRVEQHHLFAIAFRGCLMAIRQNHPPDMILNLERMTDWGKSTSLKQGYHRDELLRRIKNITEAFLQAPSLDSFES